MEMKNMIVKFENQVLELEREKRKETLKAMKVKL